MDTAILWHDRDRVIPMPTENPQPGETWQHFRGGLWEVDRVDGEHIILKSSTGMGTLPPVLLSNFLGETMGRDGQMCRRFVKAD